MLGDGIGKQIQLSAAGFEEETFLEFDGVFQG